MESVSVTHYWYQLYGLPKNTTDWVGLISSPKAEEVIEALANQTDTDQFIEYTDRCRVYTKENEHYEAFILYLKPCIVELPVLLDAKCRD